MTQNSKQGKKDSGSGEKNQNEQPFSNEVFICSTFVEVSVLTSLSRVLISHYSTVTGIKGRMLTSFVMQSRVAPVFQASVALKAMKIDERSAVSHAWKTSCTLC